MKLQPIITSLLEQDAYKFSMGQVIYHQFNNYRTEWTFKCRNKGVVFTKEMVEEVCDQLKHYCSLKWQEEELEYLKSITWIKWDYVESLRDYTPRYEDFNITTNDDHGIAIKCSGPWRRTSMYEIPVLAIVNEVFFRFNEVGYDNIRKSATEKLNAKINDLKSSRFQLGALSEFGLRRRLSGEFQDYMVGEMVAHANEFKNTKFVGTSNVYLAKKYAIKPIGTMAHELIMCIGQGDVMKNPAYSNRFAMDSWTKEYGRLLGTMLTDTIGDKFCLADMGYTWTSQFSGVRHDSGDPVEWGENWIKHYNQYYKKYADDSCNPKNKMLLFSDGLDFQKAHDLYAVFKDRINVAFGIGTFLSNDTCVPALNIVMKVTQCGIVDNDGNCRMHPVAKLSNVEGKNMCESEEYILDLKNQLAKRVKFENL